MEVRRRRRRRGEAEVRRGGRSVLCLTAATVGICWERRVMVERRPSPRLFLAMRLKISPYLARICQRDRSEVASGKLRVQRIAA